MTRRWGTGSVIRKDSGRWLVRWREGGKRRSKGGFESRALAAQVLDKVRGDIAMGQAGLPPDPAGFPPLRELATDWIERRKSTHRSWSEDRSRWTVHLAPHFGNLRPAEVNTATIRAFVEAKIRAGMNRTTIGLCVRCFSTFFSDLCERPEATGATTNPAKGLPRNLRRLYRSEHDPRFTPYVRRLFDVTRLYQALSLPYSTAYAIGVCAGLRTGEICGLRWQDVDLAAGRIEVRQQAQDGRCGPLKDGEARILQGPWLESLWPVLKAWKLASGGSGLVFPPEKGPHRWAHYLRPALLYRALTLACDETKLGEVMTWDKPWYQATRHTFASHWVRTGHGIGELAMVLGHSTTWVTERYAHIHPEDVGLGEDPWSLDLASDRGRRKIGHQMTTKNDRAETR